MAMATSQSRPRGRAEVVAALLDAARTLIAERGPDVALRDIAERANVNFGDRKSTRLNSSHVSLSRMPSSA